MKVVVSIVNFNTRELLRDCLRSILERKWQNEIEVWVFDNKSIDGSQDMVREEFPKVKLLESNKNLGFGAGHNIIFKKVKADYFLVLNSDTLIENSAIDEMVEFMEKYPDCGISSCKILGFDGRLQPNAGDLPLGLALINWLFNLEIFGIKAPSFHRNEPLYYKDIHEVGWVSGNFMMIRSVVFQKVGRFSEDYFMFFEDTEFCLRVKKAGFKIMINPLSYIKHLSGGSLDDPHLRQWGGEFKGLVYFYNKEYGFLSTILLRFLIYLSILFRIIAFALSGKFKYSLTYGKIIFNF